MRIHDEGEVFFDDPFRPGRSIRQERVSCGPPPAVFFDDPFRGGRSARREQVMPAFAPPPPSPQRSKMLTSCTTFAARRQALLGRSPAPSIERDEPTLPFAPLLDHMTPTSWGDDAAPSPAPIPERRPSNHSDCTARSIAAVLEQALGTPSVRRELELDHPAPAREEAVDGTVEDYRTMYAKERAQRNMLEEALSAQGVENTELRASLLGFLDRYIQEHEAGRAASASGSTAVSSTASTSAQPPVMTVMRSSAGEYVVERVPGGVPVAASPTSWDSSAPSSSPSSQSSPAGSPPEPAKHDGALPARSVRRHTHGDGAPELARPELH